jgi:hypothetical protein
LLVEAAAKVCIELAGADPLRRDHQRLVSDTMPPGKSTERLDLVDGHSVAPHCITE